MGSELIIVRWCDRCRAKGEDVAEHRIRIDEIDRALDLCGSCLDGYLQAVADTLGDLPTMGETPKPARKRKAEEPEPARSSPPVTTSSAPEVAASSAPKPARLTPSGRAPRTPPDPAERQSCPFCPAQSSSQNGLKQHLRTRHGLLWSAYQAGEQPPGPLLPVIGAGRAAEAQAS